MAGARPRRHSGSLGDSWGTADYSDDNVSIDSADFLSDTGSQSDYYEEQGRHVPEEDNEDDMATPMPHPRTTRASQIQHVTPTKHSTAHRLPAPRNGSRSLQQHLASQQSPEPAFIMPSMHASADAFTHPSPLRNSQLKSRKPRKTSQQSQTSQPSRIMSRHPRPTGRSPGTQSASPTQYHQRQQQEASSRYYVETFWTQFAWNILLYILGIFKDIMSLIRPLLGIIITIALLVFTLNYSYVYLQTSIYGALAPVCAIPFSSYILPFCDHDTPNAGHPPDFEKLANIQNSFEQVLADKDSYALPANMMKSNHAMRDLRSVVRFSHLPSRAELEEALGVFIETAREASDELTRYNSRVGFVTDQVISTNVWTARVLDGIAAFEANTGTLNRVIAFVNPLYAPPRTLEERIFEQYINHVSKITGDIVGLIEFSKSLLALLNHLDNQLDVIAEIAARDGIYVTRDREELLAKLSSRLGWNNSQKAASKASLDLLDDVTRYRSQAMQHVSATLLKLREISSGLENLRDGVAAPAVIGWREDVPLQWHIEVVQQCVDRLRDARGESQEIERSIRKGINRGMGGMEEERKELPSGKMPTVFASP